MQWNHAVIQSHSRLSNTCRLHSAEHSFSFSPSLCKFESYSISDWLNQMPIRSHVTFKCFLKNMGKKNENVLNSLPNKNVLDRTKFKAFADDKLNVAKILIYVFDRVENIMGKGENAGYQHFLLFP